MTVDCIRLGGGEVSFLINFPSKIAERSGVEKKD